MEKTQLFCRVDGKPCRGYETCSHLCERVSKTRKIGAALGVSLALLSLGACTNGLVDQTKAMTDNAALDAACNTAMGLAPLAGPIAPYIIAGCGSAEAIAKLATDPTSVSWVNGLIMQVRKPS